MKTKTPTQHDFKGLDDWFEIFRAGTHTDSKGREQSFTDADLDSIVANHNATQPAPLVVGHPKDNDPAYAWTDELKAEGGKLFAKAKDIVAEFGDAVEKKMYPNRSVSIVPQGDGWQLRHIGFLGAMPPAVKGLEAIAFADADNAIEFSMTDTQRWATASGLESVGRMMRRVRDWLIDDKGLETADRILPDYEIENIQGSGERVRRSNDKGHNNFSDNNSEDITVDKEFTQADVDAAVEAAVKKEQQQGAEKAKEELRYQAALNDAKTKIATLVQEGKLLPAQTPGLAEFMAGLSAADDSAFEFAASGEDATAVKKTPAQFMADFLAAQGKQITLGKDISEEPGAQGEHDYNAPPGCTFDDDRAKLDKAARDYQAQHKCDYVTAVTAVEKQGV